MTRILITSDIHQAIPKWDQLIRTCELEKPDLILIAGDLLPKWQPWPEAQGPWLENEFPSILGRIRDASGGAPVLTYFGNDDHHSWIGLMDDLEARGLCIHMDQRVFRSHGLVFAGMNRVRDYPFGYKHWVARDGDFIDHPVQFCFRKPEEFAAHRAHLLAEPSLGDRLDSLVSELAPGEMNRSIWLIHQPPAGHGLDLLDNGEGCGSSDVLNFLQTHQPLLSCHGHIHESPHAPGGKWVAAVGETLAVQQGQIGRELHYVTLEIGEDLVARNIRHSIFGPASQESEGR
ncbi:MAG: metallophosphoesterase [Verrucomicrobiae bacterium]|nr:metallophosphoesterase [Verrucomicrobiae bacterium]